MTTKAFKFSAAAGLAMAFPFAAQAALIFDPDGGANSGYAIDQFDWYNTSVLAAGGNQAIVNWLNNQANGVAHGGADETFQVYTMAKLDAASLNHVSAFHYGSNPGEISGELTMVLGYTERVSAATVIYDALGSPFISVATFMMETSADSFFSMFYDSVANADQLTGAGFTDGTEILTGALYASSGSFTTYFYEGTKLLDEKDADDWGGTKTINGNGNGGDVELTLAPTYADSQFFLNQPLTEFLTTNVALNTTFTNVDPAKNFYSSTTTTVAANVGAVNGQISVGAGGQLVASGPDVIFSTDPNTSVDGTVPEPASLLLFGSGLGVFGSVMARRRKAKMSAA